MNHIILTFRISFVDEIVVGQVQDFTTAANASLSPTLPTKGIIFQKIEMRSRMKKDIDLLVPDTQTWLQNVT